MARQSTGLGVTGVMLEEAHNPPPESKLYSIEELRKQLFRQAVKDPNPHGPENLNLDTLDHLAVLDAYADSMTCAGGRIVPSQWVCPHCGSGEPPENCFAPRRDHPIVRQEREQGHIATVQYFDDPAYLQVLIQNYEITTRSGAYTHGPEYEIALFQMEGVFAWHKGRHQEPNLRVAVGTERLTLDIVSPHLDQIEERVLEHLTRLGVLKLYI